MSKQPSDRPGTTGYRVFMWVFWYMTAYVGLMGLAISKTPNAEKDLALGLTIIGSPLLIGAVLMSIGRIRYMIRKQIRPHPLQFLKRRWKKRLAFLAPLKSKCYPVQIEGGTSGTINRFREENKSFAAGKMTGNTMTQMFRHQLLLHQDRLEDLDVQMETDWEQLKFKDERELRVETFNDGRMNRMLAQEYVKGRQIFKKNNRILYRDQGYMGADFDIVGAKVKGSDAEGYTYVCPNCGGTSTGKELVTGCPYCGTSFVMEELENRVSNYSLYKDPFFDRERIGLKINGHLNRFSYGFALLMFAGYIGLAVDIFKENTSEIPTSLPFAIFLFISCTILAYYLALAFSYIITVPLRIIANQIYKSAQERRSEELKVARMNQGKGIEIRLKKNPEFSLGLFLTNVRNKVASIHYARTEEEAEVFEDTDLSSIIPVYQNVIDCRFITVSLDDYKVHDNMHEASVTLKMKLLCLEGEKIKEKPETVRLVVERSGKEKGRNPFFLHFLRCQTCFASIDLTKGNTCQHCGNQWNLRAYDWCIKEYEVC